MNAPTRTAETTALATVNDGEFAITQAMNPAALILGPSFERVQAFSTLMCKGSVTVPKHLQGNMGDCMAVTLQALSLGFNPFGFAQKTHITQSGALGYEGQLVSAILTASGAIEGDPTYEHIGDWSKVLGKVEERKSDKGGKYYVATYTKADEAGLGVIVRATLKGETKPRELTVMMSQAYPRFSTQWATDPRQQICNLAIRKFTRLHKPGVLLGFKFVDEEDDYAPPKDMGAAQLVASPELLKRAHDAADKGVASYSAFWKGISHSERAALDPETTEDNEHEKLKVRAHEADKKRTVDNAPTGAPAPGAAAAPAAATAATPAPTNAPVAAPADGQPPTYAYVAEMIGKAQNEVALDIADDWVGEVADEGHRAELVALSKNRRAELQAAQGGAK